MSLKSVAIVGPVKKRSYLKFTVGLLCVVRYGYCKQLKQQKSWFSRLSCGDNRWKTVGHVSLTQQLTCNTTKGHIGDPVLWTAQLLQTKKTNQPTNAPHPQYQNSEFRILFQTIILSTQKYTTKLHRKDKLTVQVHFEFTQTIILSTQKIYPAIIPKR